ncbi:hypothetical protein [Indiicoccus explosivorum]|uniref:hypothetical protein n=1 Tax=Indiicoccus explosivorum TaxID=1917864 RepID=UPI000B44BC5E|nr:hypothetical protein [Indiicoccus explosivorum]
MEFNNAVKGAGIAVLAAGILAGCSGDDAAETEYLTPEDAEGYFTEDELTTWAEEQNFYTQEELEAWADEQGFYTQEELDTWADEQGIIDEGAVEVDEIAEEEPTAADAEFDFGAIDRGRLEEVYLGPLEWTPEEFNDYTVEEFDMNIADFADFDELESMVGPVEDILAE